MISVVSPVYFAEHIIGELVGRLAGVLSSMGEEYEIILVNDASPDRSWEAIKEECSKRPYVKGINLSRNFGQHNAISAGLRYSKGEWVVVMDCDLQDRPEEIAKLLHKALEGFDIVYARRKDRQDGSFKKLGSRLYHKLYDTCTGRRSDAAISNFGIFSRKVVDEFNLMPEKARSFPAMVSYLGFRKTAIDVKHDVRLEGKSSYSLGKLVRLGVDSIVSQSARPLHIAIYAGMAMSLISFVLALYNVIARLAGIITVPGYTMTVFSIWFTSGMLMFVLGVCGLYVGNIFEQVKGRPLYVIEDKLNLD